MYIDTSVRLYYIYKCKLVFVKGGMIVRIDRIKLITEMARQDITQLQLAELTGASRATISGVQNGRSCSSRTAVKIADALKVPLETLLEN